MIYQRSDGNWWKWTGSKWLGPFATEKAAASARAA